MNTAHGSSKSGRHPMLLAANAVYRTLHNGLSDASDPQRRRALCVWKLSHGALGDKILCQVLVPNWCKWSHVVTQETKRLRCLFSNVIPVLQQETKKKQIVHQAKCTGINRTRWVSNAANVMCLVFAVELHRHFSLTSNGSGPSAKKAT